MCPVCWISGFIAVLFGGSFIAVANHPISWVLSIILISYATSMENLKKAMDRIKTFCDSLK